MPSASGTDPERDEIPGRQAASTPGARVRPLVDQTSQSPVASSPADRATSTNAAAAPRRPATPISSSSSACIDHAVRTTSSRYDGNSTRRAGRRRTIASGPTPCSAVSTARICARARALPMQKCGPAPNHS